MRPSSSRPARTALLQAAIVLLATAIATSMVACDGATAPPPPPPPTVNAELGLTLATLPPGLAVDVNQGPELLLSPSDPSRQGRLVIAVESPRGAVNLVVAVEHHRGELEGRPGAEYKGAQELVTPMGPAFWSRGRYQAEDGSTREETAIMALHPSGDRLLKLVYTYPAADDSPARVEELLAVLGEIGPG